MHNFKTMITRYQGGGDHSIIAEVLSLMQRETKPVAGEHTTFIANRINKVCTVALREFGYDPSALTEFRSSILSGVGIDIYAKPDLMELLVHSDEVKAFLGEDSYEELCFAVGSYLDFVKFRDYTIVPALEHALSRVDANRHEREMVSYINRAFYTEYLRLLAKYRGTIRLGRRDSDGNFRNVYVFPNEPEAWSIIFDRPVEDAEVTYLLGLLTKTQRDYAQQAYEVAAHDISQRNMRGYRIDGSGDHRLKFRYMAEKLGVEESNLRKTIDKIRKRTAQNVPIIAY